MPSVCRAFYDALESEREEVQECKEWPGKFMEYQQEGITLNRQIRYAGRQKGKSRIGNVEKMVSQLQEYRCQNLYHRCEGNITAIENVANQ
jgi:hypothetical protein